MAEINFKIVKKKVFNLLLEEQRGDHSCPNMYSWFRDEMSNLEKEFDIFYDTHDRNTDPR